MKRTLQICGIALSLILVAAVLGSLSTDSAAHAAKPAPPVVAQLPAVPPLPLTISTNSNANPLFVEDVDNPARQPFAINMCNVTNSLSCGNVPHEFTAPTNRRLVIEQISGECPSVDPAAVGVAELTAIVGGTGVVTVLPQAPNAALGVGFIIPATQTRIYPDPGTFVDFGFNPAAGAGGSGIVCNVSLIGHTVRP